MVADKFINKSKELKHKFKKFGLFFKDPKTHGNK
jgi:hypothetical protein